MKVYFISGLGADATAFHALRIPGVEPVHLDWMPPLPKETMQQYARRMADRITEKDPIIVGLSFGGMMAVEISKHIPVKQLILVSSAKTKNELPPYFRICRYVPFHKMLPLTWIGRSKKGMHYFFGARNPLLQQRLEQIINSSAAPFNKWAINCVVNWNNTMVPKNVVHIHGKADHLLPSRYVNANHLIQNGSHFMIVTQAKEIAAIIQKILSK